MLQADAVDAWLEPTASPEQRHAVMGAPAPALAWHQVGRAVGNVRNNMPDLVEPAGAD